MGFQDCQIQQRCECEKQYLNCWNFCAGTVLGAECWVLGEQSDPASRVPKRLKNFKGQHQSKTQERPYMEREGIE